MRGKARHFPYSGDLKGVILPENWVSVQSRSENIRRRPRSLD
jgi:hypothetical protein